MSNTQKSAAVGTGGIGFTGLLLLAFIILKLMGYITWSWVWVLSPIWISALIYTLIFLGIMFSFFGLPKINKKK